MRIFSYIESRSLYSNLILDKDIAIENYQDLTKSTRIELKEIDPAIMLSSCVIDYRLYCQNSIRKKYYSIEDDKKREVFCYLDISPNDFELMEKYYEYTREKTKQIESVLEQLKAEILIKKYL